MAQDLNIENNVLTITPLKGSYARQLRVSPKLMGLLMAPKMCSCVLLVDAKRLLGEEPTVAHHP